MSSVQTKSVMLEGGERWGEGGEGTGAFATGSSPD